MKQFYRKTLSLCPECLREIPATIYIDDHRVVMEKVCQEHGFFEGLVENDATFYLQFGSLPYSEIYPGLFVDVTSRCNMTCNYCFYPVQNKPDPTIGEIVDHCRRFQPLAPFLFTGGEPTMREDLSELVTEVSKLGKVWILTNGIRLADPDRLDGFLKQKELIESIGSSSGLRIIFSLHPKEHSSPKNYELKMQGLENIFKRGLIICGVNFTILDVSEIDEVLGFIDSHLGKVGTIRIRSASNVAETTNVHETIYNSDKYRYLLAKCQAEGIPFSLLTSVPGQGTKACYMHCLYRNQQIITFVCWPDKTNIDLNDIKRGPYCKGKDNQVRQIVYSLIKNERKASN